VIRFSNQEILILLLLKRIIKLLTEDSQKIGYIIQQSQIMDRNPGLNRKKLYPVLKMDFFQMIMFKILVQQQDQQPQGQQQQQQGGQLLPQATQIILKRLIITKANKRSRMKSTILGRTFFLNCEILFLPSNRRMCFSVFTVTKKATGYTYI
jgi:hypothetical protein